MLGSWVGNDVGVVLSPEAEPFELSVLSNRVSTFSPVSGSMPITSANLAGPLLVIQIVVLSAIDPSGLTPRISRANKSLKTIKNRLPKKKRLPKIPPKIRTGKNS